MGVLEGWLINWAVTQIVAGFGAWSWQARTLTEPDKPVVFTLNNRWDCYWHREDVIRWTEREYPELQFQTTVCYPDGGSQGDER